MSNHNGLWTHNGRYNYVVCTLNCDGFGEPTQVFRKLINSGCTFIHAGRETAPTTGQKHWQCYFEAPNNWETKRWNLLLPHGSFQQAKGTAAQCMDYQSKQDPDPYVYGTWRNSGRGGKRPRTDMLGFVKAVRKGLTDAELFMQHSQVMVNCERAAMRIRTAFMPERTKMPCTRILWGDTYTGKSFQARTVDKCEKVKGRPPFLIGYTGTKLGIVFEEFRWQNLPIEDALDITDETNCPVEVKGHVLGLNAQLIYFCSNTDPTTWWPKADPEQRKAFLRRIRQGGGEIRHCTTKYVHGTVVPSLFDAWKTGQGVTCNPFPLADGRPRSRTPPSSRGSSTTPSPRNLSPVAAASRLRRIVSPVPSNWDHRTHLRRVNGAFKAPEQLAEDQAQPSTRRPMGMRLPTQCPVGETPLPMQYNTAMIPSQDTADTDVPRCAKCNSHIDECECLGL